MVAPAENPVFQIGSQTNLEGEFGAATGDRFNFLGFVPDALGGEAGSKGVESHNDAAGLGGFKGGEAGSHHVSDGEILWPLESGLEKFGITQAREREGADASSDEIVADEIPLIVDTAKVVGLHTAALHFFSIELEVIKLDRALLQNSLGKDIENTEFLDCVANGAERNGLIEILKRKEAFLLKIGGHFLKSGFKRLFKDGAPVLLEGFLRDEQSNDLALAHGHTRKGRNRLRVAEPPVQPMRYH